MSKDTAGTQAGTREDAVRLAIYLAREKGLGEADLLRALDWQAKHGGRFEEALTALGLANPVDIESARVDHDSAMHALPTRSGTPGQLDTALATLLDPFDPHSERIRALRTELLLREAGSRVLSVIGAASGDGCSMLAAQLAVSFASVGQPTLLIDADLRDPQQHRLFNLGVRSGLADALDGSGPAVFSGVDGVPELFVLTAGIRVRNPQELLAAPAFLALLGDICHQFRHVIVDTPALALCSDALIVASAAGAAVTVARLHATPLGDYTELVRRLRAASVRVIGGVVNAAHPAA